MKKGALKRGQIIFIARYVDGPEPDTDTILIREYQVEKLLPSVFQFDGKHDRIRARWDTSHELIASAWPTPEEALDYLEEKLTDQIVQARLSLERFEKQKHHELYTLREWRRKNGVK